ncbi:hypothetical protein YC2023_065731 [Brassica napus]
MVRTDSFMHPCCEFEPCWRELLHDVSGQHTDMNLCFRTHLHTRKKGISVDCTFS